MILEKLNNLFIRITKQKSDLLQLVSDSYCIETEIQKYNTNIIELNEIRSQLINTELNLKSALNLIEEEIIKIDEINQKILNFSPVIFEKKSLRTDNINKIISETERILDYVDDTKKIVHNNKKITYRIFFSIICILILLVPILMLFSD